MNRTTAIIVSLLIGVVLGLFILMVLGCFGRMWKKRRDGQAACALATAEAVAVGASGANTRVEMAGATTGELNTQQVCYLPLRFGCSCWRIREAIVVLVGGIIARLRESLQSS